MIATIKGMLTRSTIAYGGAILVIVLGVIFVIASTREPKQATFTVEASDFTQEVSVSGRVIPAKEVDLVFSQSGRVAAVYADVGDAVAKGTVLAMLENGDAYAEVAQKKAAYESAAARLTAVKGGTRPEKIAIAETQVKSAKAGLVDAMRNVYTNADDALNNRIDQFFYNSHTQQPKLAFIFSGQQQIDIEWGRFVEEEMLKRMKARVNALTPDTVLAEAESTVKDLDQLRLFLDVAAEVVNALTPTSDLPQTKIDTYRTSVATARANMNTARQSFTNAKTALEEAEKNLALEKAGSRAEDVTAEEAQVAAAKSDLANAEARYRKTLITAPFAGVVTAVNAKTGGNAALQEPLISLMSTATLQVESFVPEINTPFIKVGDSAVVTLDAYGDTEFGATVISMDPAETIRDGVSTYRAVLEFKEKDSRVRSGMTANVRITTEKREEVLVVPKGVVGKKDGETFVMARMGNSFEKRLVQTGSVSSLGMVEILTGLEKGDQVLLESVQE